MDRRTFSNLIAAAAASLPLNARAAQSRASMQTISQLQSEWKSLLAPGADVELSREPLKRTDAEWKRVLSAEEFRVLREEGTERPGSSPLNDEKRAGVFVWAGWSAPLSPGARRSTAPPGSPKPG